MRARGIGGLVFVFTMIVMLLFVEGGLRIFASVTHNVRGATFDSELGWRLVPQIRKEGQQWADEIPATTNSLGWRDEEFSVEKPFGYTRIIALGDSFTFGSGVDYGKRFSEVMERNTPRTDVINMGVFAYGTDQELLAYEIHGRQYQPDVVVLNVYLGNDLEDIRSRMIHSFPKPYFTLDRGTLQLVRPFASWLTIARTKSYLVELILKTLEGGELRSEIAPELRDVNEVDLLRALIHRFSVGARRDDTELVITLIHPRDATEEVEIRNERVALALTSAGYNVLDLQQAFAEPTARGIELYMSDGHWNPAGHRLFAEILTADLLARGWVPQAS